MMIPPIKALYLRLLDEAAAHKIDSAHPEIWEFDDNDIAYLEQIKTIDDLLNYESDSTGKREALAYDCALAMGLSKHDAMSVANDH